MNVAFRADASNQIGSGHFMRCLALAIELKKQGAQIRFLSRNLPIHLANMLSIRGIEHISLSEDAVNESIDELAHAAWLGVSQKQDSLSSIKALSDQVWDWLVVDHYALDARWESALHLSVKKIMAIDDLADRQHDCDVLLDHNNYADMQTRYTGKVPAHCQLLLGARYALLRDEFRIQRQQLKVRTGEVKSILVFFGGVDEKNYTMQAIEALSKINSLPHVDVVIGAQHPFKSQIERACSNNGFVCHEQTPHMAKLMANADLAIGAGGTATWERCCLGLSTISLCVAENQSKLIDDNAEAGVLYAPELVGGVTQTIQLHTESLLKNSALIRLISNSAMKLVDGKGVLRVATAMACSSIVLKEATPDDSRKIFEWRNNPKIRRVSKTSDLILWSDHKKWFEKVLTDSNRHLLIGSIGNAQIGVVRFDIEENVAEVSLYLVPGDKFVGQGKNLLRAAENWLKLNNPEISRIDATVLDENEASKKLFDGSNYRINMIGYRKELRAG